MPTANITPTRSGLGGKEGGRAEGGREEGGREGRGREEGRGKEEDEEIGNKKKTRVLHV